MSYAVSITQDGTVLQTAGEYVAQDIVVGMSDSIKLPAQTFSPSTVDQTIPAGKYLSGTQTIKGDANLIAGNIKQGVSIFGVNGNLTPGITPSGTKQITANGTHDVTQYASANMNVVSLGANTEVLTVNVSSLYISEFTLLNSATIRDHFDSPNLAILVKKMAGDMSTARTAYLSYCGKTLLNGVSYGYSIYNNSSGIVSGYAQNSPINEQYTGSIGIYVTADGNLQFVVESPRVRAGDYLVCIWW